MTESKKQESVNYIVFHHAKQLNVPTDAGSTLPKKIWGDDAGKGKEKKDANIDPYLGSSEGVLYSYCHKFQAPDLRKVLPSDGNVNRIFFITPYHSQNKEENALHKGEYCCDLVMTVRKELLWKVKENPVRGVEDNDYPKCWGQLEFKNDDSDKPLVSKFEEKEDVEQTWENHFRFPGRGRLGDHAYSRGQMSTSLSTTDATTFQPRTDEGNLVVVNDLLKEILELEFINGKWYDNHKKEQRINKHPYLINSQDKANQFLAAVTPEKSKNQINQPELAEAFQAILKCKND